MKPLFLLLAGTLTFSACNTQANTSETATIQSGNQPQNGTKNGVKTIGSAEAKNLVQKQQDLVVLDVRTPEEFAKGHLKNAVLLNKYDTDFEAKISTLDKNKTYLVYCAKGGRSGEATRMMQNLGFKNIYDATEGFETLKKAGLPVEK